MLIRRDEGSATLYRGNGKRKDASTRVESTRIEAVAFETYVRASPGRARELDGHILAESTYRHASGNSCAGQELFKTGMVQSGGAKGGGGPRWWTGRQLDRHPATYTSVAYQQLWASLSFSEGEPRIFKTTDSENTNGNKAEVRLAAFSATERADWRAELCRSTRRGQVGHRMQGAGPCVVPRCYERRELGPATIDNEPETKQDQRHMARKGKLSDYQNSPRVVVLSLDHGDRLSES